ncbi:MAG: LysM peptidoglycan-binding domain-containing protein [Lentisphaeraceae bacterium]|nr:LysM peptidoglycan-binding domain-containing protein [Lentisphaeraceae bacterium]
MAFKKIFVFTTVIAFHCLILGTVYLSTRDAEDSSTLVSEKEVEKTSSASEESNNANSERKPSDVRRTPNRRPTTVPRPKPTQVTGSTRILVHTVGKGDYLGKIASRYKVRSTDIISWNNLSHGGNRIMLGQKLKIHQKK